jgi:hypothetical protein
MIFTSKRLLVAAASLLIIAICISVGIRQGKVNAFQSGVVPGSLEALALDVIAHNETSVTIGAPKWVHAGVSGIDEAVANYTVVVAHPVSKNGYVWNSDFQMIGSWYKFVITETLVQKPYSACSDCPPSPNPPAALLPLNSSEVLVPKAGGSVVVNGVTITSVDEEFPDYQLSQSYLLFLNVDTSKGVGMTSLAAGGVFTVSPSGQLAQVAEGAENSLANDIQTRYGNSLASLRASLH